MTVYGDSLNPSASSVKNESEFPCAVVWRPCIFDSLAFLFYGLARAAAPARALSLADSIVPDSSPKLLIIINYENLFRFFT